MRRVFGGVVLFTAYCPACDDNELVGGEPRCSSCGGVVQHAGRSDQAVVESGGYRRRKPPKGLKGRLVVEQEGRCFWCDRKFGQYYVTKKLKLKSLAPVLDHALPHSFTGSCESGQYVAACQLCNKYKSNRHFTSDAECRRFIEAKIASKGITFVIARET